MLLKMTLTFQDEDSASGAQQQLINDLGFDTDTMNFSTEGCEVTIDINQDLRKQFGHDIDHLLESIAESISFYS